MLYRTIFEEIAQRVATNFDLQQRHNKSPTWEIVELNKMGALVSTFSQTCEAACIEILQSFISEVDNLLFFWYQSIFLQ